MLGNSEEDLRSRKKKSVFFKDFKQQKCHAWIPRYTTNAISPLLIGVGLLLIPLGVAILIVSSDTSTDMKEMRIDYTNCRNSKNESQTCAEFIASLTSWSGPGSESICECEVEFELTKPIKGKKVNMYYTLENFHQNLRRYVRSRDDKQLLGEIGTFNNPKEPSEDCEPMHKDSDGKFIYPCGVIANSMFNDSIQLYFYKDGTGLVKVDQERKGIAWPSDKKYRYKNPKEFYSRTDPIWQKFTKPKDWSRSIWDLDPEDPENNGVQNEDFIVWMRLAAFSNFQKMYRIITPSVQPTLGDGLPAGKYHLKINYTYEVMSFKGKKGVLLSTTTIFGQRNLFQGISTISYGGVSIVLGIIFLVCGCNNKLGKGSFTKSK